MLVLTRRLGESLIIGNDIKIAVSNICKNQINLCVNDSQCVIVNLQEGISIRDGIIVKVVKIDKAQVELGINAPKDVTINREEVYRKDQMENVLSSTSGVYPKPHLTSNISMYPDV